MFAEKTRTYLRQTIDKVKSTELGQTVVNTINGVKSMGKFYYLKGSSMVKSMAPTTSAAMTGGIIKTAHASDDALHEMPIPWNHRLPWQSYDHMSIRRGFHVYQQVCSACHSLEYIAYRNLVDVAYTEEEVKAMAADIEVKDGPNDAGEMFDRPGKLADHLPKPYENENAARAANNGALPVDLSLVVKARHGGANYIFSLLTGYMEPPAGVTVKEGLNYNPYFPGGQIAMPQPLKNEMLEYEDGTDASISQMAKDVTTFLSWAAEPHQDEHKKFGMKTIFVLTLISAQFFWWKRMRWSIIKNRKIDFVKSKKHHEHDHMDDGHH